MLTDSFLSEMKIDFLSAMIAIIAVVCLPSTYCKNESILIVALPLTVNSELTLSWERGLEILPGALAAAEIINNDSSLLPLKLLVADSGPVTRYDHPYSGNVLEVIANLIWQKRHADIIGIAGLLHPDELVSLSNFHFPAIFSLIRISESFNLSNVFYMTAPISTLADSVIAFVKAINQTKTGLITELHHSYFFDVSNELICRFSGSPNVSLSLYLQVGREYPVSQVVDEIVSTNTQIIVLSVRPSVSIQILCEAYRRQLMWPKYIWILYSHQLDDLTMYKACSKNITEGVFTFQIVPSNQSHETHCTTSSWNSSNAVDNTSHVQSVNPFSLLLHNAILALTSAVYNKSRIAIDDSSMVYIYQMLDGKLVPFGIYDGGLNKLSKIGATYGYRGIQLPIVLKDFSLPVLIVLPLLFFITTTALLVLFLYFHRKPTVKSSSVPLSLLLFLGCYLQEVYAVALIIRESQDIRPLSVDLCMVNVWLSNLGLAMPVILATILVKMLRVYHILSLRKVTNPSFYTTHVAPFVYTSLILLPNIIVLMLWTIIDTYHKDIHYVEHPGFITVEERCISKYTTVWSFLLIIFFLVLSLAVIIVAIKSRKIRLKLFKDTKKVNLFIFLSLFVRVNSFAYWIIFSLSRLHGDAPDYILYASHMIGALLCQVILFLPKVWPPLREKLLTCQTCIQKLLHCNITKHASRPLTTNSFYYV